MPSTEEFNPLTDPIPEEIHLANAPLIRVIAQVRFPMIASIQRSDFLAPFQEALREKYPILRQEQSQSFNVGSQGVEASTSRIWRFTDTSEDWRVSLAPDFVALETTEYSDRQEFLSRLNVVLQCVEQHLNPGVVFRNGIRYIDRVDGESPQSFKPLIRSEVAGVLATPFGDLATQTIVQSTFKLPDRSGQLNARWGIMPPNSTPDPSTIAPTNNITWLLDLDAFSDTSERSRTWDTEQLVAETEGFAERIYAFFRWAVTDKFIRQFSENGGRI